MPEETFQEKTEPATPKRREETRRRGKVAKSVEMNSAFIIVFGLLILYFVGGALASNLTFVAQQVFSSAALYDVNRTNVHHFFLQGAQVLAVLLAPLLIGLTLIGLAVSYSQVGFLFTLEPLRPKWEKLSPRRGIKKLLLSRRSLAELVKGLAKVGVVGIAAYLALEGIIEGSLTLLDSSPDSVLSAMAGGAYGVGLKTGLTFLILAVLDYVFQRHEHERDLRMTKQEVKEENKMLEGDPLIKSRIRSIQRQIAYKRMMQQVPKADVVVTNPLHLAVALQYDGLKMAAPKVVAKGAELLAQRIKEIATEHGVPIVEDKPLAQALYKSVEVGEMIPEKLFHAVAQVLAYIYRLKQSPHGVSLN